MESLGGKFNCIRKADVDEGGFPAIFGTHTFSSFSSKQCIHYIIYLYGSRPKRDANIHKTLTINERSSPSRGGLILRFPHEASPRPRPSCRLSLIKLLSLSLLLLLSSCVPSAPRRPRVGTCRRRVLCLCRRWCRTGSASP